MGTARRCLVLVVATLTLPSVSRGDVPLFSGGFVDASGAPAWNNRHGAFRPGPQLPLACVVASGPSDIVVGTSECADARCSLQHLEAQHVQYLATDVTYSADVRVRTRSSGSRGWLPPGRRRRISRPPRSSTG